VIALGLLNFVWGFLPELSLPRSTTTQGSLSVFSIGPAYVPILLLTAGLLAMTAFLPGEARAPFAVAAVSAGGAVGAIVSLGTQDAVSGFGQVSKGMGAILLVVFGIIQAVVAVTAFVVGSGFAVTARAGQPTSGAPGAPAGTIIGPAAGQAGSPPLPQPYPGQAPDRYVGQAWPAAQWGAGADRPSLTGTNPAGGTGWGPAGHGPVPPPSAYPAGPGAAPWAPSRSPVPPSADARSADTDPHGIPVIDPSGTPPAVAPDAVSAVPGPGEPADDRPPPSADGSSTSGH